ncbi:MAG TPA: metalloregulator ArsR/SmtB family transcription factor [Terriglobales bacterium]|nr:metalloregulator ArsR/SmtB family transcription factor [Terriglobales bacterium]
MRSDIADKQQAIFCMLARFGEAMSSPKRLKIISLLSEGPKSVEQLADLTDQSTAATSAHLKLLRASGLVEGHKEGRHVWCSLAGDSVTRVWLALRNLGEELLPEVREIVRDYFEHPETLSALTMTEIMEEVRNNRVILLDLRDQDEYRAGHLPHAKHIELKDLKRRVDELAGDRPILAYCRGPYCITALKGVTSLRKLGIPAQRLPFGVPEWKAAGLPLDRTSLRPSRGRKALAN